MGMKGAAYHFCLCISFYSIVHFFLWVSWVGGGVSDLSAMSMNIEIL
jgi:hypothetical protein